MTSTKQKKRVPKGEFGYFRSEQKHRLAVTALLLALPVGVFIAAWIILKTRMTIWTVGCVVGCLPACRSIVNLIMLLMRKPMDKELYEEIRSHAGDLTMAYEMYMTFYEKSAYIDAFAICGNEVVGYSSDPKIDTEYVASEAQKIVRKNGYKVNVRILKDLRHYQERLDSMREHRDSLEEGIKFQPDEKYPEYSRNEMIRHTILAICL